MPNLINATVFSNFAAVEQLDLLRALPDPVYIAQAVYEELQAGVEKGYGFLAGFEERILPHQGAGWFLVIDLQGEYEQALYMGSPTGLHPGEAMSLAIGAHRGWGFLTDDRGARRYAAKLGVTVTGTVGLLRQFIKQDAISI